MEIEDAYREPFEAWQKQPGPPTADALLGALRPVLDSAVRQYGGGQASPTLASRAKLIALGALPRYDPQNGRLKPFLMSHLQGLQRLHHKQQVVLNVPERQRLDAQHLTRSEGDLADQLGRPPTDRELADHSGFSLARLTKLRGLQMGVPESMAGRGGSPEDSNDPAVRQQVDTRRRALVDFFYHGLADPADQMVLRHRLGLAGHPVLGASELARKLKVTPAAVSLRAGRLQERLNRLLESGVL